MSKKIQVKIDGELFTLESTNYQNKIPYYYVKGSDNVFHWKSMDEIQDIRLVEDETCKEVVDVWTVCEKCRTPHEYKPSTKIEKLKISGVMGAQVAYNRDKLEEIIDKLNGEQ